MATTKFTLLEGVWTQVATADAIFQNLGSKVIQVTESATAPTDSSDFKLIEPLEIYEFNPTTGLNLYAKSIDGTSAVSVDGVGATLVEGEVTINTTTPLNATETNSGDIKAAVEKLAEDNFEDDITAVETWLELPENIKAVSFILDCSDNTEATLEYTFDRAASPSVTIESELGTLVNDKESGYLAGAVAQVRMDDVVTNAVVEVKSSLSTDLVGDNNDLVYTSKLTGTAGDAITVKYDDTTPTSVAEVKSTLSTDLVGDNNDIVYTSKLTGTAGDAITITYLDPEMESQSLAVIVAATSIQVYLATNDQNGGEIISTADEIKAEIAATPAAHALVGTADKAANDGSGVVTAMAGTPLAGGVDEVNTVTTVTVTDTDIVVGLAKDVKQCYYKHGHTG
jgi:hypothetical protein